MEKKVEGATHLVGGNDMKLGSVASNPSPLPRVFPKELMVKGTGRGIWGERVSY